MPRFTTLTTALFLAATAAAAQTLPYDQAVPERIRAIVTEADYQANLDMAVPSFEAGILSGPQISRMAGSPCAASLIAFQNAMARGRATYAPLIAVINAGMTPPPVGYTPENQPNMWAQPVGTDPFEGLMRQFAEVFTAWCVFLPRIEGDEDNGLAFIQDIGWFYYQNPAAQTFTQGVNPMTGQKDRVLAEFLKDFSDQRGDFMDTEPSTRYVREWMDDPRIEIGDYDVPEGGFRNWNDFFSRSITTAPDGSIPSRPVTMPDRSYVVVSPTDCIMNPLVQTLNLGAERGQVRALIDNPLQLDTVIDVKSYPLSMDRMLAGAPDALKREFVGGSGLSCILMPNTYHHYHAPVDGEIVYAERVQVGDGSAAGTYGYYDFPNWVPLNGNVAQPGTDFSQFEVFQRGVIIMKTTYSGATPEEKITGYVAQIPVGLNTIGSVTFDPTTVAGTPVTKGVTRLGGFLYGGSLNILLFSKNIASPAVQTRLGNQIAILNAGEAPALFSPR
ncbi:MAG: phosphatidylserine decarboxylase [Rhodobacter sp.]|nr:phosphatidylserine decarboxylase [Rhodobacter sp.]